MSLWGKRVFCIVSGASQNIGKFLAVAIGPRLGANSVLVLTSRSKERVQEVEKSILAAKKDIKVVSLEWDLSKPDSAQYEADLLKILKENPGPYDAALLVHNASKMSSMALGALDWLDCKLMQEELNINVVSVVALNNVFLRLLKEAKRKIVVDISAPSAQKPIGGFSGAAISRAPRYQFLTTVALENPDIRVAHFNPGLVDTSSLREISNNAKDPKMRAWIQGSIDAGKCLTGEQCAGALLDKLEKDDYQSGAILDAFELLGAGTTLQDKH